MKSNAEALRKRGYITSEDIKNNENYSDYELLLMINSPEPVNRSAAVHILSDRFEAENMDFVIALLERLCLEKCLYTKIEICKTLEKGSIATAKHMIPYLGHIGSNQYQQLPESSSEKVSYPLPRDIIARSLARMDVAILPSLIEVLSSNDRIKITEAIDAIGYMLFYNRAYADERCFHIIMDTIKKYCADTVIVWKCVTCLSAFQSKECVEALYGILNSSCDETIRSEAKRSLKLIEYLV